MSDFSWRNPETLSRRRGAAHRNFHGHGDVVLLTVSIIYMRTLDFRIGLKTNAQIENLG
jgi:hypothetical protein